MSIHGYKVRDRNTGLYLLGGVGSHPDHCKWSNSGKVWSKLSYLRSAANGLVMIPPWWELVILSEKGSVNGDIVIKTKSGFKEKDVLELLKNKIKHEHGE